MTSYNDLRDGQEFYGNGYKKGYEDALDSFSKWLKEQTLVGFSHNQCEVLVMRNRVWVNAVEIYLKEREAKND